MFDGLLQSYTARRLTNDSDSLNAYLGLLSGFNRNLFPKPFACGLPVWSHPFSLGWMHDRLVVPRRRPALPSWICAGWEGRVSFPRDMVSNADPESTSEVEVDLEVRSISHLGDRLTVEGWVVDLDVRTEPFSEVYIPAHEDSISTVMERNFLHNNTLQTVLHRGLV